MSVQEQLVKNEPERAPRAIEEVDLVKIWVLNTFPTRSPADAVEAVIEGEDPGGLTAPSASRIAQEIAAWENRIRNRGWQPGMVSYAVGATLCIVGHAIPNDASLADRVRNLEGAVGSLDANMQALVQAFDRAQGRGIFTP